MKDGAEAVWTESCWWLLVDSLLVGPIIGMKFIYQSDSILLILSWNFPSRRFEEKHLLWSVAHFVLKENLHLLYPQPSSIYNLPGSWIFSCAAAIPGPPPVQLLHQEDLNLPTFVKIGEPTDEDFFLQPGRMVANIMVINDKHWQTYYGIHVCIDNLILSSFTL